MPSKEDIIKGLDAMYNLLKDHWCQNELGLKFDEDKGLVRGNPIIEECDFYCLYGASNHLEYCKGINLVGVMGKIGENIKERYKQSIPDFNDSHTHEEVLNIILDTKEKVLKGIL